jgi:hypothetical protein
MIQIDVPSGPFDGPPVGQTCQNCSKHPATKWWTGEGGMIGAVHGFYQAWCDRCVVVAQLEHAKAAAKRVKELERELKKIDGKRR